MYLAKGETQTLDFKADVYMKKQYFYIIPFMSKQDSLSKKAELDSYG